MHAPEHFVSKEARAHEHGALANSGDWSADKAQSNSALPRRLRVRAVQTPASDISANANTNFQLSQQNGIHPRNGNDPSASLPSVLATSAWTSLCFVATYLLRHSVYCIPIVAVIVAVFLTLASIESLLVYPLICPRPILRYVTFTDGWCDAIFAAQITPATIDVSHAIIRKTAVELDGIMQVDVKELFHEKVELVQLSHYLLANNAENAHEVAEALREYERVLTQLSPTLFRIKTRAPYFFKLGRRVLESGLTALLEVGTGDAPHIDGSDNHQLVVASDSSLVRSMKTLRLYLSDLNNVVHEALQLCYHAESTLTGAQLLAIEQQQVSSRDARFFDWVFDRKTNFRVASKLVSTVKSTQMRLSDLSRDVEKFMIEMDELWKDIVIQEVMISGVDIGGGPKALSESTVRMRETIEYMRQAESNSLMRIEQDKARH